ncbi:hypothetical protein J31TS6_17110 [Brevibacillus reuszeri]|nr:hypothetical protein J31TS6_17110 [Brevibacillus reuszeri]
MFNLPSSVLLKLYLVWPGLGIGNPWERLILMMNVTLDGCCDHTQVIADEELYQYNVVPPWHN